MQKYIVNGSTLSLIEALNQDQISTFHRRLHRRPFSFHNKATASVEFWESTVYICQRKWWNFDSPEQCSPIHLVRRVRWWGRVPVPNLFWGKHFRMMTHISLNHVLKEGFNGKVMTRSAYRFYRVVKLIKPIYFKPFLPNFLFSWIRLFR